MEYRPAPTRSTLRIIQSTTLRDLPVEYAEWKKPHKTAQNTSWAHLYKMLENAKETERDDLIQVILRPALSTLSSTKNLNHGKSEWHELHIFSIELYELNIFYLLETSWFSSSRICGYWSCVSRLLPQFQVTALIIIIKRWLSTTVGHYSSLSIIFICQHNLPWQVVHSYLAKGSFISAFNCHQMYICN